MIHAVLLTLAMIQPGVVDFDEHFTGRTLRFDYHHGGNANEEQISLDQIRREDAWPGSRTHLLDPTNLGKYLIVIVDPSRNRPIYSRGFASIYGEWELTGEAKKIRKTFHESQRFPEPKGRFQILLKKRSDDGSFREIFSAVVDPTGRFVNRSPIRRLHNVWAAVENGPPSSKVDLLILGDGYTEEQLPKYRSDVERFVAALFDAEPFRAHRKDFNVWVIDVPSLHPGITNPRSDTWNPTPLGLSFNAFDSERYVLTFANREIREIAAQAPYDTMILIGNSRKYGGGGIFNLYATCTSDTEPAPYVFVHEFGHSFAGLADEYYTSQVSYEEFTPPGVEPWEPNATALLDPEKLKWHHLVDPSTPIPTPWNQERYDEASNDYQRKRMALRERSAAEEEVEALFREVKRITTPMLAGEKYADKVGAFEGAAYEAKGLYRPQADCIMFTRNPTSFCRVCSGAIEEVIRLYSE